MRKQLPEAADQSIFFCVVACASSVSSGRRRIANDWRKPTARCRIDPAAYTG